MAASHFLFGSAGFCGLAHLAVRVLCRDPEWDYEVRAAAKQFGLLITASSGIIFVAMGCTAFIVGA